MDQVTNHTCFNFILIQFRIMPHKHHVSLTPCHVTLFLKPNFMWYCPSPRKWEYLYRFIPSAFPSKWFVKIYSNFNFAIFNRDTDFRS